VRFGFQSRAGRILDYLVQLEYVRPGKRVLRQSAGLGVAFNKLIRADPVDEVLAVIPDREHYVRVALVHGAEDLVGDEPGHLVDQPGALAKPLLKSFGKLRADINAVSYSYHCGFSLWRLSITDRINKINRMT